MVGETNMKIVSNHEIKNIAERLKADEKKIVFTNGCFDILHAGHVRYLQAAKELGYEFNGVDAPKNEKDYYGLRYSQFVVPLVKAVQELNEKLDQKQAENDQLRAMLLELEKRIAKLEKNASN